VAMISVREYGRLHIGEFDPSRPSVTAAQAEQATNLKPTYGFEVFRYVNGMTKRLMKSISILPGRARTAT
jgi:5-methylcytosine-specific restriction enzyme subunit McrC